jgi:hypothetical protein
VEQRSESLFEAIVMPRLAACALIAALVQPALLRADDLDVVLGKITALGAEGVGSPEARRAYLDEACLPPGFNLDRNRLSGSQDRTVGRSDNLKRRCRPYRHTQ